MVPSVAQDLVDTFLPYSVDGEIYVSEDFHFIDCRLDDYLSLL